MDETSGINLTPEQVASRINAPAGTPGILHESTAYVSINGPGGQAKVDVMNRRMVLNEDYNFEVDGDFALIGSAPSTGDNPSGDTDLRQVNPALYFGDPNTIASAGNFVVGEAANETNETSADAQTAAYNTREKGSLKTQGKLYIQGDISGSTTLAAKDDVTLEINRFFDPVGNSESNFSVFSEKNISILPPPILEGEDDRTINEVTGEVEDVVVGYTPNGDPIAEMNISEKNLRFTGLIYAGENVTIDLQDTRREPDQRRNMFMEGAIVAKNGHLDITNADQLRLVYNPQFVDRLLPSLAKAGQRRIEVTGWRTTKPDTVAP